MQHNQLLQCCVISEQGHYSRVVLSGVFTSLFFPSEGDKALALKDEVVRSFSSKGDIEFVLFLVFHFVGNNLEKRVTIQLEQHLEYFSMKKCCLQNESQAIGETS